MITVLTGGTGGAKFVWGLAQVVPAERLTVIVNTGDDLTWWGLHVSPDVDSVMYALAGQLSPERGWGLADESFRCLDRMRSLGAPSWFQLGDLDLATHIRRSELMSQGKSLSEVTAELCRALSVKVSVLPMTNDHVETRVSTRNSNLNFQEYFVRDRHQAEATDVKFEGIDKAQTAPGVLEAITRAEAVFLAPSNPVTSIGPILALPGVRDVLRNCTAPIAAISPIVAGQAVSGPAAQLMSMRKWPVSPDGIAQAYRDFVDLVIADEADREERHHIEGHGVRAAFTNTVMRTDQDKTALARFALDVTLARHHEAVQ
ncbi:MAG TPA: 2-phospho-L-lactate transferase [Terriglobales bacterium]|nr:2-phospho-L-lactate transferase [Terriglobales bacterium]